MAPINHPDVAQSYCKKPANVLRPRTEGHRSFFDHADPSRSACCPGSSFNAKWTLFEWEHRQRFCHDSTICQLSRYGRWLWENASKKFVDDGCADCALSTDFDEFLCINSILLYRLTRSSSPKVRHSINLINLLFLILILKKKTAEFVGQISDKVPNSWIGHAKDEQNFVISCHTEF